MKKVFGFAVLLVFVGFVWSCSKAKPEELVAKTAEQYYSYLLNGDYEAFVDGCYQPDTIRKAYRLQLVENAKMFIDQQRKEHEGIQAFQVVDVQIDTAAHTANVFIDLTFGNGTNEQILLPMVQKDDLWMMR